MIVISLVRSILHSSCEDRLRFRAKYHKSLSQSDLHISVYGFMCWYRDGPLDKTSTLADGALTEICEFVVNGGGLFIRLYALDAVKRLGFGDQDWTPRLQRKQENRDCSLEHSTRSVQSLITSTSCGSQLSHAAMTTEECVIDDISKVTESSLRDGSAVIKILSQEVMCE